jgi:transcriptional regulator with XRE-family HTH domain
MKVATTAERLQQIMRDRKLKQVDLVRMCEPYCEEFRSRITKSDLSQYLSGKVTPGQWKISILEHALDVNPAWLMGYDVPMEREPQGQDTPRAELIRLIGKLGDRDVEMLLSMVKRMLE